MTLLQSKPAVAYQGARRRYFTRAAAENSNFWAALKRHCECVDPSPWNDFAGETCSYHKGDHRDRIEKLRRRFLRLHFQPRKLETRKAVGGR